MAIAKRFNVACSTIYKLWECVECTYAMGIINSLELSSRKKFLETAYLSNRIHSGGCQESATNEEMYKVKTGNINGSVKNHNASLDCCVNHSCSL